jgi:uncharacterized protein YggE
MCRLLPPAILATLLVSVSLPAARAEESRSITVNGEGVTGARPDMALVTTGVTSQAPTAAEALSANSRDTAAVIERIKGEGVEARDIQTSGLSLQPIYVFPQDNSGTPPRITGYTASNTVTIRVRTLGGLGALLDKAVAAGANTINAIEFVISRQSELMDEARKDAVKDAARKAAIFAGAAGAKLGQITRLVESGDVSSPRPLYRMRADAASSPVPVEAGESELKVTVGVTYALD